MIEKFIDQIITMKIFADAITIVDDKGYIRYLKEFRENDRSIPHKDFIGKHIFEVYPYLSMESSTTYKALQGIPTVNRIFRQKDFRGIERNLIESMYPIKMGNQVVGAASITKVADQEIQEINIRDTFLAGEYYNIRDIIGTSKGIQDLKAQIMQIADTDLNILIHGETGTGKEMVAQSIHQLSFRKNNVFYSQNCAAIPATLLESIFFGTKKGAYTGAVDRAGIFEQAHGGTVFLDEINSLDMSLQAKILKVIEEKRLCRLGSNESVNTDFRLITAMNESPFDCIQSGTMRSDLFFRISSVLIDVPPLRERKEDISILVNSFIARYNAQSGKNVVGLDNKAAKAFLDYQWPGNVRELKNAVESACVFSKGAQITMEDIPAYILRQDLSSIIINDSTIYERDCFEEAPQHSFQNFSAIQGEKLQDAVDQFEASFLQARLAHSRNHTQLAKELGVSRQTLLNKIRKYKLHNTR